MQPHRTPTARKLRVDDADGRGVSLALAAALRDGARTLADALGDVTAARRISLARAEAILASAEAAGLVNPDGSFAPVFRAELSGRGLTSLAQLWDDEADELEAFTASS